MKQQRATLCSHDRNRSTHEGELVEVKLSSYIESLAQQRSQRLHFPKDALLRSNIAGQKDDPSGTWSRNVRFGSKADIHSPLANVRFTPKSGHRNSVAQCPLCAKSGHAVQQKQPYSITSSEMESTPAGIIGNDASGGIFPSGASGRVGRRSANYGANGV